MVPRGYRLTMTVQGKDFGHGPGGATVRVKESELPNAENSGPFFGAHPNPDPAVFGGKNSLATGGSMPPILCCPA